jgi:flagellar motor switch protein FliN/FliY
MSESAIIEERRGQGSGQQLQHAQSDSESGASHAAENAEGSADGLKLDSVMRIPVTVQIVLGSTTMPISELMKLSRGAIVALDARVGEPVDVVVNGRVVARGELVVLDDDDTRFGISLTEVVGAKAEKANG